MISSVLWPYDETEIDFRANSLLMRCPWANAEVEGKLSTEAKQRTLQVLRSGVEQPNDLLLVQELIRPFQHLPVFYVLPRSGLPLDPHVPNKKTKTAERWKTEEILEVSRTAEGVVDPRTLLSCLRRQHLIDAMNFNQPTRLSELFASAAGDTTPAVAFAIRQNLYVTSRCLEVLAPALELHPIVASTIEDFMADEDGHDKLMEASLRALGMKASEIAVAPLLVQVMNNFKDVATTHLVAFAFVVDMFERTSPKATNPIITELERLGKSDAAKPLQKHLTINDDGAHGEAAFEFLNSVGGLPNSYAEEAVGLAENASDLSLAQVAERYEIMRTQIG